MNKKKIYTLIETSLLIIFLVTGCVSQNSTKNIPDQSEETKIVAYALYPEPVLGIVIDSDGKLSQNIIPQVAITDTFVVSSASAMLGLTSAQVGDVAVRTDLSKTFILKTADPSVEANWQELMTPTDKVTSVNGKTGAVSISLSELGGVSEAVYNTHLNSSKHLTNQQLETLSHVYVTDPKCGSEFSYVNYCESLSELKSTTVAGALSMFVSIDGNYNPPTKRLYIGVNSSKVLTPNSTIDGGTY